MGKVTLEDELEFVKMLIDRDLSVLRPLDRTVYINKLADFLKERVAEIRQIAEDRARLIGENRPEVELSDISLTPSDNIDVVALSNNSRLWRDLLGVFKPGVLGSLASKTEFTLSGKCLRGSDASKWLYERKYPYEYSHIHVFKHDLCLLLGDDDVTEVAWIKPDGVYAEGEPLEVVQAIYEEYLRLENRDG